MEDCFCQNSVASNGLAYFRSKGQGAIFIIVHFLTNGPKKLECYITLGWKGLIGTNALTYWVYSQVMKKMTVVKTAPGVRA